MHLWNMMNNKKRWCWAWRSLSNPKHYRVKIYGQDLGSKACLVRKMLHWPSRRVKCILSSSDVFLQPIHWYVLLGAFFYFLGVLIIPLREKIHCLMLCSPFGGMFYLLLCFSFLVGSNNASKDKTHWLLLQVATTPSPMMWFAS